MKSQGDDIVLTVDRATAQDVANTMTFSGPVAVHRALYSKLAKFRPLVVATDGGVSPKNGPTGWAWIDEHGDADAGSLNHSTSNVAELTALEKALLSHPNQSLHIIYDSQYAVKAVTKNGHVRPRTGKTGKPNRKQIYRIIGVLEDRERRGLSTTFEWVKGHTGHPLNEAADKLATRMRLRGDNHTEKGVMNT